jgi:NADH-quinone oxidoreductase subunit J
MLIEIVSYVLIIATVIAAAAATQVKDITRAIVAFTVMNILIAAIFYILGAPYIAAFQLLVYAGAVTVLFLAAIHTMRGS